MLLLLDNRGLVHMAITKVGKEWFIYFVDLFSSSKPREPRIYDGFGGRNV